MGTNCAPLLADIFLYSYEAEFIQSLLSAGKKRLASQFNFTYRYIDDVLYINNPDFENYLGQMYPPELEIKDTTESNTSASYLDLLLSIGRDGQLRTSLYDKRDDFNFHITNFPFLSSNIPSSPAYGVFISQLIRYARACSSYECFILRAMRLSNKLLGQGYVKERLKSSLRKFYGRYGDLTKQYEVPLSRMLHDILDDDHIQWHPPLIGHYTNFWPLLIWTLLPNLTFYLIVQGFHRTYATGAACQQGTLTPPDTWSCPTLGLACVLMSRPISPELVLSPDFWISNIPRYFSFACIACPSGGMVIFTLPFTTSEMISISTSQTFRSWVVIFHHRRPMACLSLNLYDTPGLAPRMNVLFWGPGDFPVSYSNRDTLWNAWNRHSGSFMVDTGILLSNME